MQHQPRRGLSRFLTAGLMYEKPTTSTGWFDAFVRWIGTHGFLQPTRTPAAG